LELEQRLAPATLIDPMTVTYLDADGQNATVSVNKPVFDEATINQVFKFDTGSVSGDNSVPQQLQRLDLSVLPALLVEGASVTITAVGGLTKVGYINATNIDLGPVTVYGDLGRINSGDGTTSTTGLPLLNVQSIGKYGVRPQGPGGSLVSNIKGPLGTLFVNGDIRGGSVVVTGGANGKLDSVFVAGSLAGSTTANSGLLSSTGPIGLVVIGSNLRGGSGNNSGQISATSSISQIMIGGSVVGGPGVDSGLIKANAIGPIQIGGDLRGGNGNGSGRVRSLGAIGNVTVTGSLIGVGPGSASINADGSIGLVQIGGDALASEPDTVRIQSGFFDLAGVTIGGSLVGGKDNSANIFSAGNMGPIHIEGNFIGGSGANAGQIFSKKYIDKITVGGSVIGGTGGETGEIKSFGGVGPVQIGGDMKGGSGHSSGRIRTNGDIGDVTIQGSLIGMGPESGWIVVDGGMGQIQIAGDVRGGPSDNTARITTGVSGIAGITIGGSLIGETKGSGVIFSFGLLGPVVIGANIQGGLEPVIDLWPAAGSS
jgi:hypothetical protein